MTSPMVSTPTTYDTVRPADHVSPRRLSRTTPQPYSPSATRQATRKIGSADHCSPPPSVNGGRSMVMPCPLWSIRRLLIRGGCALSVRPQTRTAPGHRCDRGRLWLTGGLQDALRLFVPLLRYGLQRLHGLRQRHHHDVRPAQRRHLPELTAVHGLHGVPPEPRRQH